MAPSFIKKWKKHFYTTDLNKLDKIKCSPLSDILDRSSLKDQNIDFLSLDVEGGEYEVLKTLNFAAHQFGVIFYEADEHNPLKNSAMKALLESYGYPFRIHALRSNFHVNANFHKIYADIL